MSVLASVASDVQVQPSPSDGISSLKWSPVADILSIASWDGQVRIYEVQPGNNQTIPKISYTHDAPVLSTTWNHDGTKVFSGGADNAGRMLDAVTGQSTQVAMHQEPIRSVMWADVQGGVLATASWDKTLKYWDLRQNSPVATINLPERAYAADSAAQLLAVATANKQIQLIDLRNPTIIMKDVASPLKYQTRCIRCIPDGSGYAVGSVEGRVGFQYLDRQRTAENFSFRCHRKPGGPGVLTYDGRQIPKNQHYIWPVNDISFHPEFFGAFSTAGSDGSFSFWNKDKKMLLRGFEQVGGPITSASWNATGNLFAYGVSYDWHRGHEGNLPNIPLRAMLHVCKDDELRKKITASR